MTSTGRGDDALAAFRQATTLAPDNPHLWLHLGKLLARTDAGEAVEALRRCLALSDDSPAGRQARDQAIQLLRELGAG